MRDLCHNIIDLYNMYYGVHTIRYNVVLVQTYNALHNVTISEQDSKSIFLIYKSLYPNCPIEGVIFCARFLLPAAQVSCASCPSPSSSALPTCSRPFSSTFCIGHLHSGLREQASCQLQTSRQGHLNFKTHKNCINVMSISCLEVILNHS